MYIIKGKGLEHTKMTRMPHSLYFGPASSASGQLRRLRVKSPRVTRSAIPSGLPAGSSEP